MNLAWENLNCVNVSFTLLKTSETNKIKKYPGKNFEPELWFSTPTLCQLSTWNDTPLFDAGLISNHVCRALWFIKLAHLFLQSQPYQHVRVKVPGIGVSFQVTQLTEHWCSEPKTLAWILFHSAGFTPS